VGDVVDSISPLALQELQRYGTRKLPGFANSAYFSGGPPLPLMNRETSNAHCLPIMFAYLAGFRIPPSFPPEETLQLTRVKLP
jgi:hypothetical protein